MTAYDRSLAKDHAVFAKDEILTQAGGCMIGHDYPAPVVVHAAQRDRALALFRAARG